VSCLRAFVAVVRVGWQYPPSAPKRTRPIRMSPARLTGVPRTGRLATLPGTAHGSQLLRAPAAPPGVRDQPPDRQLGRSPVRDGHPATRGPGGRLGAAADPRRRHPVLPRRRRTAPIRPPRYPSPPPQPLGGRVDAGVDRASGPGRPRRKLGRAGLRRNSGHVGVLRCS
jgi:hypothetical protein